QVGTIGPSALASPNSLVIIIGHTAAELSQTPGAREVRSIETAPQGGPGDRHPGRIELILAVVAGALLLPVLIFIAAATRLAAARLALRRVQISPLGVTRHVTPAAPHAWRAIPLLAGVAELAFFVGRRPATTSGQIRAYGAGFVLAMAGLVIAGPWLTMLVSRVMARRTGRPAVLIAGRRLSDNPRAAFRAVSGLIVALFISTASAGVITTIVAYHSASTGGVAGRDILS